MQCSGSVGGPEIARYYRHWPVFHVSATFTTRGHVTLERALNVRAARAVTTMDFSSNARGNRFVSIAIVPEIPFSPYHAVHRPRNLENWPTIDTETKRFVCNNKVVFQATTNSVVESCMNVQLSQDRRDILYSFLQE